MATATAIADYVVRAQMCPLCVFGCVHRRSFNPHMFIGVVSKRVFALHLILSLALSPSHQIPCTTVPPSRLYTFEDHLSTQDVLELVACVPSLLYPRVLLSSCTYLFHLTNIATALAGPR